MSTTIDCSAALVASPRLRVPVAGARLHVDDAQPRLENRLPMPTAVAVRGPMTGSKVRGFETAAAQGNQDGRTAIVGAAYVTTTKQHFSTRSGPPTSRPPA